MPNMKNRESFITGYKSLPNSYINRNFLGAELDLLTVDCKELVNARKRKGLTQEEVALVLGCSNRFLRFYEKGKKIPNIETLHNLSNLYNVEMKSFLKWSDRVVDYKNNI